jgi:ankyrin repeat protein
MKELNEEDPEGLTVLSRYLLNSNFEIANRLILRGCDINYINKDGKTILILAIINNNDEAVKMLLGKGVDIHVEDLTG